MRRPDELTSTPDSSAPEALKLRRPPFAARAATNAGGRFLQGSAEAATSPGGWLSGVAAISLGGARRLLAGESSCPQRQFSPPIGATPCRRRAVACRHERNAIGGRRQPDTHDWVRGTVPIAAPRLVLPVELPPAGLLRRSHWCCAMRSGPRGGSPPVVWLVGWPTCCDPGRRSDWRTGTLRCHVICSTLVAKRRFRSVSGSLPSDSRSGPQTRLRPSCLAR